MPQQTISDDAPGTRLFPQFTLIHGMASAEVAGLTDQHLDWTSDHWEWSKWSIRRQVSHVAAGSPGWLLRRWGSQLFPRGYSELGELAEYSTSPASPDWNIADGWATSPQLPGVRIPGASFMVQGRWLDESKYWEISALLKKLDHAMLLAHYVLARETVASMRKKELPRPDTLPHWRQFAQAHPSGVRWHPTDPNFSYLTLEATFRHLYFDAITHVYNIQRLKRAQGLIAVVEVPFEGYWALPDWDRSEP